MRNLADTISRLAGNKQRMRLPGQQAHAVEDRLTDLHHFGSNPGALRARAHVPATLKPGAALVVVLHGCTQTAAAYDHGSGWSRLADRHGFAVLFPEQRRANNPNLCFNWFEPQDTRRGSGEALSIRQMIDTLVAAHDLDRGRVFITGLSAGGAMASTMLAIYPEVFAGGAIMAGLAHGIARTVPEAFDRMRGSGVPGPAHLQRIIAGSSAHDGPWPSISVWHGEADTIVVPGNAHAILEQWKGAHAVGDAAPRVETGDGHRRLSWADAGGRTVLELYSIAQMGHGTAIDPRSGICKAGPYMLDAGISSTHRVAHAWGLVPAEIAQEARPAQDARPAREAPEGKPAPQHAPAHAKGEGIKKIIEDALRNAGLMS